MVRTFALGLTAAACLSLGCVAGLRALPLSPHKAHADSTRQTAVQISDLNFGTIPGARFMPLPTTSPLPGGQRAIPVDEAIKSALSNFDPRAAFPLVHMSAQLGLFSDDQYASVAPSGQRTLHFQGRPAWIVAFTGLDIGPTGGPPPPGSDPAAREQSSQAQMHHEEDVVVDATSGQYLEQFTFR